MNSLSYTVPENLSDRFQNIYNFSNNMTLKDSSIFNAGETSLSELFKSYLFKYFETELSNEEVIDLIDLCNIFNKNVEDNFYFTSTISDLKTIQKNRLMLFLNLDEKISENIIDYFTEKHDIEEVYINMLLSTLKNSSIGSLFSYFIDSYKIKEKINNNNEYILTDDEIIEMLKLFVKTLLLEDFTDNIYLDDMKRYINNAIEAEKIFIIDEESIQVNTESLKYSASELEKKYMNNGEYLLFFNLVYKSPYSTNSLNENENKNKRIIILYKEFNKEYTYLFDSTIINLYLFDSYQDESNKKNLINLLSLKNSGYEILNYLVLSFARNMEKIINKNSNSLLQFDQPKEYNLFRYRYGNFYLARKAEESEIISYYIGDNIVSNGYGKFSYQKEEIEKFLDIFKETRFYYYKVLLNLSFVNERNYKFYEKMILITMSIMRFVSDKASETTNIDLYNLDDMKNFLSSFGFNELSKILKEENDFYKSEEFSRNIIKNYINLVKNKGSRDVIKILENIFSLGNQELVIYNNALVKFGNSYKFVRVNHDNEDIFYDILNNPSTSMNDFIQSDKYWVANESDLDEFDINIVNTKYITPEISTEISEIFNNIRIIFALVNYLEENKKSLIDTVRIDGVQIYTFLNKLKEDFFSYLYLSTNKMYQYNDLDTILTFYIDEAVIKDYMKTYNGINPIIKSINNNLEEFFNTSEPDELESLLRSTAKNLSIIMNYNYDSLIGLPNYANDIQYKYEDAKYIRDFPLIKETTKNIILPENNPLSKDESISELRTKIISSSKLLIDYFDLEIGFSLGEKTESFLKYLLAAIDYFTSYTTEVYNVEFYNNFNNNSEKYNTLDRVIGSVDLVQIDSFFYDEELEMVEVRNE